ncbi:hypothetical protein [Flavicella sp.]|uniref:hypothetical protein n=1 Tax=Flavicella sp. TaxID=2957742 RepID=UPI0026051B8D|nr:hypothetical protein [Flavicella sp.]MDG1804233.1 hypothetical protein [Flavicella sp.]MDG2279994.1 hypothetical protein [Flavicella sp.]
MKKINEFTVVYNECIKTIESKELEEKQEPGKARAFIVYDELNRPVLTQNGLQRPLNQWSYIWYDDIGRPIKTGMYTYTAGAEIISRTAQQQLVTDALKRTRNYMSDYVNYDSGTMEVLTEVFRELQMSVLINVKTRFFELNSYKKEQINLDQATGV